MMRTDEDGVRIKFCDTDTNGVCDNFADTVGTDKEMSAPWTSLDTETLYRTPSLMVFVCVGLCERGS